MAVIYTDTGGTGYDFEALKRAHAAGTFEAGSRVPDILEMYRPSAPVSSPGGSPTFREATPPAFLPGEPAPGSYTPTASVPNVPAPGNDRNQIAGWYDRYFGPGRAVSGAADIDAWLGQVHGGERLSLGDIQHRIANSPEAAAYALSQGFGQPPATAGPAPSAAPPSANPATIYGNDPHASLLINEVLSRLAQLRTPIDTTAQDAYIKNALERVTQLQQPPFSEPQTQALLTRHMQPLTQARDSAKQQAAEDLSRRGIGPTSGLFHQRMSEIDQAYERGVANVTNTLNIKGIDQQTQNAQMSLSILSSIQDMTRQTRQDQEGLSSQLVPTAGVLPNLDERRLQSLLQASNASDPTSLIGALTGLGQLGVQQQSVADQRSAANAYSLAQMIYALMNGASGLF